MASTLVRTNVLSRGLIRPITTIPSLSRPITTESLSHDQNLELLNKQRSLRPNSPWMIYEPQIPAATSIATRVTGVTASVGLYSLFLSQLLLPALGVPFDSSTLISTYASFPEWGKVLTKSAIAFPAVYHSLNGVRHLNWDFTQSLFTIKESYTTAYAVIGTSVLASVGLVFYL